MRRRLAPHAWAIGVAWAMSVMPMGWRQLQFFPYDYPVYWAFANQVVVPSEIACPYPARAVIFFWWLRDVPIDAGWWRMWTLLVLACGWLTWRFVNGAVVRKFPLVALGVLALAFTGIGGGIAGSLRCGNVDLILAALATTAPGAVVACCIKPHLLPLVLLHAAVVVSRRGWSAPLPVRAEERDLHVRRPRDTGRSEDQ